MSELEVPPTDDDLDGDGIPDDSPEEGMSPEESAMHEIEEPE